MEKANNSRATFGVLVRLGLCTETWDGRITTQVLCPFHADTNASLSVDLERGVYYCFGCGVAGDVIDLVARVEDISRLEALLWLGSVGGIVSPVAPKVRIDGKAARKEAYEYFSSLPVPGWKGIRDHYLLGRGFERETLIQFDVRINQSALYPIIIPLREQGRFLGYVCRRIEHGDPKYLYNRGFQRRLALPGPSVLVNKPLLVVEGMLDLMMAVQHGWGNTCALLGWRASAEQITKLRRMDKLICGTDMDEPGIEGWRVLVTQFLDRVELEGQCVYRLRLPKGVKDVGECTKAVFRRAMDKALGGDGAIGDGAILWRA